MGYTKKTFDGDYLEWYKIINSSSILDMTLEKYAPIASEISSLPWDGMAKKYIDFLVSSLDKGCNDIYSALIILMEKVKICDGVLFDKLILLKEKIDNYNSCVDEYESISRRIAEIEREKKVRERNNNTNEQREY